MTHSEIFTYLKEKFSDKILENSETKFDPFILVQPAAVEEIAEFLRDDDKLKFETLHSVSGVDMKDKLFVVYHLFSFIHKHKLVMKVQLPVENPSVPTVWRTADWHERELFDMFGVHFENHPDLKRILCPDDWEGFPLRKDYKAADSYRGMKIERNVKLER